MNEAEHESDDSFDNSSIIDDELLRDVDPFSSSDEEQDQAFDGSPA